MCFLPLFQGMFPLLALEIRILLNFSLSSGGSENSSRKPGGWGTSKCGFASKVAATALMTFKFLILRLRKEIQDPPPLAWWCGIGIVSEYRKDSCAFVISAHNINMLCYVVCTTQEDQIRSRKWDYLPNKGMGARVSAIQKCIGRRSTHTTKPNQIG